MDLLGQSQPHLVRLEPVAAHAGHLHRLLALRDPPLGGAAPVIEPHDWPAVGLQIGPDESEARKQVPGVELHPRHNAPRRLPTRRLVQEALVPY